MTVRKFLSLWLTTRTYLMHHSKGLIMKDFLLKTLAKTIEVPGKAVVSTAKFVSPFLIKNQYIRELYRKNINLFRLHLALSVLLLSVPVVIICLWGTFLGAVVAIKDFLVELTEELTYEFKSVYRPIVRGFKEGLPRD
jgi:hypothetical protein